MLPPPSFEPCGILVADMVGYSHWLAREALRTHDAFSTHVRRIFQPAIHQHGGRLVKTTGDGVFAIFGAAGQAERCARAIQASFALEDSKLSPGASIQYRISVHFGDVIVEKDDIFGIDVNIAVHMHRLASPGGICISGEMFSRLDEESKHRYAYDGRKQLKNLPYPVEIYVFVERTAMADLADRLNVARRTFLTPPPKVGVAETAMMEHGGLPALLAKILQDSMIVGLTRFRDSMTVTRLRTAVDQMKGGEEFRRLVSDELRIDYLVHASCVFLDERMICSVYLEHVRSDELVWATRLVARPDDVDDLHRKVADEVVVPINLFVQAHERQSWNAQLHTKEENSFREAQRLMSSGTLASLTEARRLLGQLLDSCGEIATVLVALARTEHDLGVLVGGPAFFDALERGSAFAKVAIEVDDLNAQAHAELALHEMKLKRGANAARIYQQALKLNPYDPMVWADWADCLTYAGRADEALPILERVLAGWPRDRAWVEWNLCDAQWALDRPDKIVEILDGKPDLPHVHRFLAASYARLGRLPEARRHADKVRLHQPGFAAKEWSEVVPFAGADRAEEYVDFLQRAGL